MHALDLLKPGGTLVYAVCSLQEDEGPARIDALLARDAALKRVPVSAAELPGLAEAITPGRRRPHPALDVGRARRHRRLLHRAAHGPPD